MSYIEQMFSAFNKESKKRKLYKKKITKPFYTNLHVYLWNLTIGPRKLYITCSLLIGMKNILKIAVNLEWQQINSRIQTGWGVNGHFELYNSFATKSKKINNFFPTNLAWMVKHIFMKSLCICITEFIFPYMDSQKGWVLYSWIRENTKSFSEGWLLCI